MWAAVLAATGVLAGEPQCAPALTACYYSFDTQFGDAFRTVRSAAPPYNETIGAVAKQAICNRQNWVRRELCTLHCPLRLEVTQPPELRMAVCIADSLFLPYKPLAHIDLFHPLNGQEMEVIPVGGPGASRARRYGCDKEDYAGVIYGGKIALLDRGACFFDQKMAAAAAREATAAFVVNSDPVNDVEDQLFQMTGNADIVPPYFPSGVLPRHHGNVLLEALDAGKKVFGKIVLDCAPVPALESVFFTTPRTSEIRWDQTDDCPNPKLESVCNDAPRDEDRLCAKCAVVFTEGRSGARACIRGNFLLPRREVNKIEHQWSLPVPVGNNEAVWVMSLPGGGCSPADFADLDDKVVFLKVSPTCLMYEAARHASAAGVRALILVPASAQALPLLVHGPSQFVHIPVHGISSADAQVLERVVLAHNTIYRGVGYLFPPGSSFEAGELPDRPITPAPPVITVATPIEIVERPVFEMNIVVGVYFLLIAVVLVGCVVVYLRQRANAVVLPEIPSDSEDGEEDTGVAEGDGGDADAATDGGVVSPTKSARSSPWFPSPSQPPRRASAMSTVKTSEGAASTKKTEGSSRAKSTTRSWVSRVPFTIPMSVAIMAVSLVCMVVIGMTTYWWAFTDGQLATDAAQRNSEAAQNVAYSASIETLDELVTSLHSSVGARVEGGIVNTAAMGEQQLAAAAALFTTFDGTWQSFFDVYADFVNVAERAQTAWVLNVFTTQGFFVNPYLITDYREDAFRNDGVNGSVAVTNNGFLYGTNRMSFNPVLFANDYFSSYEKADWDVQTMLGGYFGDPIQYTADTRKGAVMWSLSKFTFPQIEDRIPQPLSVFAPLFNRFGERLGTVEARTWWSTIADVIHAAVDEEHLANATVLVFDATDGTVIAHNRGMFSSKTEALVYKGGAWRELYGAHTVHTLPQVEVRAYANFLDAYCVATPEGHTQPPGAPRWRPHSQVTIDQAEHYTPNTITAFEVGVRNGVVSDLSGDHSSVRLEDGFVTYVREDSDLFDPWAAFSGGAEAEAEALPKEVVEFLGTTKVFVGRHLSPRSPRVIATRVPAATRMGWNSSRVVYKNVQRISATETCVAVDARDDAGEMQTRCLLKEPWLRNSYTITARIKPARAIEDTMPTDDTPVLFTDAEVGDSDIRLFANGQLYLNVLSYGCRTDAYRRGVPGGAWTTITAVVDYERLYCAVYVNGTLSSREGMAGSYRPRLTDSPFIIGGKFVGLLDRLVVHNVTLSEAEIRSLHDHEMELAREVPSRLLYAAMREMRIAAPRGRPGDPPANAGGADPPVMPADTAANVHASSERPLWSVAVLLDRNEVKGIVEENHRVLMSNLAVNVENVQRELRQRQGETILAMLVIALFAIFALLLFSDVLSQPYALAAIMMTDASLLKFDAEYIAEIEARKSSAIAEVRAWNVATMLFLKSWTEHSKYIPHSLVFENDAEESAAAAFAGGRNSPGDDASPAAADKTAPDAAAEDDTMPDARDPQNRQFVFNATSFGAESDVESEVGRMTRTNTCPMESRSQRNSLFAGTGTAQAEWNNATSGFARSGRSSDDEAAAGHGGGADLGDSINALNFGRGRSTKSNTTAAPPARKPAAGAEATAAGTGPSPLLGLMSMFEDDGVVDLDVQNDPPAHESREHNIMGMSFGTGRTKIGFGSPKVERAPDPDAAPGGASASSAELPVSDTCESDASDATRRRRRRRINNRSPPMRVLGEDGQEGDAAPRRLKRRRSSQRLKKRRRKRPGSRGGAGEADDTDGAGESSQGEGLLGDSYRSDVSGGAEEEEGEHVVHPPRRRHRASTRGSASHGHDADVGLQSMGTPPTDPEHDPDNAGTHSHSLTALETAAGESLAPEPHWTDSSGASDEEPSVAMHTPPPIQDPSEQAPSVPLFALEARRDREVDAGGSPRGSIIAAGSLDLSGSGGGPRLLKSHHSMADRRGIRTPAVVIETRSPPMAGEPAPAAAAADERGLSSGDTETNTAAPAGEGEAAAASPVDSSPAMKKAGLKWLNKTGIEAQTLNEEEVEKEVKEDREKRGQQARRGGGKGSAQGGLTQMGKFVRLVQTLQPGWLQTSAVVQNAAVQSVRALARRGAFKVSTVLPKKKIGYFVAGINGWHGHIGFSEHSVQGSVKLHCQILTYALSAFKAGGGVCDGFYGDRFVASFGAVSACNDHVQKMCRTALGIQYAVESDRYTCHVNMHMALSSGGAKVGKLGNSDMKRLSFISPLVPWTHALERYARYMDIGIVADKFTYQDASDDFHLRILGDVQYSKRRATPIRVGEITGAKRTLFENDNPDEHAHWNQFVMAVLLGEWDAADDFFAAADESAGVPYSVMQALNAARLARNYTPIELDYH